MTYAIRLYEHGGPEVLRWERVDVGLPRPGELLVRQMAAGINFMDISQRKGRSPIPIELPCGLGNEAAGVVEAVGDGVTDFAVGDRIAYAGGGVGAYAELRLVPTRIAIKLPNDVGCRQAAAMMLKGMTAQVLLKQIAKPKPGDTVLSHAASSGVGVIACQWLKHLGVKVIGTVGSDEKASAALANGCDHVIVYTREDIEARVLEITKGAKVSAVFDSLGAATFVKSLNCIEPRGLAILYGQASGPVGAVDLGVLQAKGSLFVTRPSLSAYTSNRADLLATAHDLFEIVASGAVKVTIGGAYRLQDVRDAHRDVEERRTIGSTVLEIG